MPAAMSDRLQRPLRTAAALLPLAAGWRILQLTWRSYQARVAYGFDIEWMEGGMLAHAWRLRHGLGIYTLPSADWVPYIYPPLYPWLLSLLGEPSYAAARSLSFLATLAAAAAAVFAARRERAGWGFAAAAGLLFLSAYDDGGSFFDLARNDALAIGLGAWAMALCRAGSPPAVTAGGLLLFLAFTAKHNLAAVGLPILLWLWRYRGWRRAALFAAASALPALIFLGAMQLATEGRFLVYLLQVPAGHPLVGERAWPRAEVELWSFAPWINGAALISALGLLARREDSAWDRGLLLAAAAGALATAALGYGPELLHFQRSPGFRLSQSIAAGILTALALPALLIAFYRSGRREGARYWVGIGLVLLPLVALMRAHHGGFINVSIPGYWLVSVAAASLLGAAARRGGASLLALSLLAAWQLHRAAWDDPERYLPTAEDTAAGERVLALIAGYEGEVLMPHFPWYPALVGKTPSFPLIALWDIDHRGGPYRRYAKDLDAALAERRWDAVITPNKPIEHGLKAHYRKAGRVGLRGGAMRTRTGWRVQPQIIWEPKPQ